MEGGSVFNSCSSFTEVNMPKLTSVEGTDKWGGKGYYFYKCTSLKTISIPLLKVLPNNFLDTCSSLETVIGDNITYLGEYCFSNDTKLTTLNLSNCITFKNGCLNNTPLLTNLTFSDNVELIDSKNAFNNNGWYNNQPSGLIRIGKVLYKYKGTYPSNTSIVIPDDIVYITPLCFYNQTNIVSVTMNDNIKILNNTFAYCTSLKSIDLKNVTELHEQVFMSCTSLKSIDLKNVTTLIRQCFRNCSSLESIDLSKVVTYQYWWGGYQFDSCTSLKTVKLNTTLTDLTMVGGLFNNCTSLVDDINLENITKFGRENFSNCTSFKGTTIQFDKVSVILYNCFLYCSSFTQNLDLQKLVVCEEGIFSHCSNLSSVHLYNITTINKLAFDYCTSLRYIRIDSSAVPTLVDVNAFDQDTCNFYVVDSLVDSYKSATNWSTYASRIFSLTQFSVDFPNS